MDLKPFSRNLRKNQTYAEYLLWQKLRNKQLYGVKFRRQQQIGSYIVDFASYERMIIIELDGGQHNSKKMQQQDALRTAWLQKLGYRIIRFWDDEVIKNLQTVLEQIHLTLALSSKEREEKI